MRNIENIDALGRSKPQSVAVYEVCCACVPSAAFQSINDPYKTHSFHYSVTAAELVEDDVEEVEEADEEEVPGGRSRSAETRRVATSSIRRLLESSTSRKDREIERSSIAHVDAIPKNCSPLSYKIPNHAHSDNCREKVSRCLYSSFCDFELLPPKPLPALPAGTCCIS